MEITLSIGQFAVLAWFALWGVVAGALSVAVSIRDYRRNRVARTR